MNSKISLLFVIIILNLFFNNKSYSQQKKEMKDIPFISNLDSMIGKIPSFKINTNEYITHLITIEESRILIGSYKQGTFLKEIDSLSTLLNFEFGTAFYNYASAIFYNNYSPDNTLKPITFAEKAFEKFTSLNDTTGIFLSNILMARTTLGYLRYLDNNNSKSKTKSIKDKIRTSVKNKIIFHLEQAKKIAIKTNDPKFKIHVLYNEATQLKELTLNEQEIKEKLSQGIYLINRYPENQYWLIAFYNIYGNTLVDQDSLKEAIQYHSKCLTCGVHNESDFKYVIYNNIGSDYDDLKINDSAIYYYKKSLEELSKNKEGDPLMEILVHNQISEKLELLNKFDDALNHKKIAFNLLQKSNDKSILNAFNLQKNYETIKEKEIAEKILAIENKNAKAIIWIGASLLIVLLLAFIKIIRSSIKLKKAYSQIQILQTTRENFYSIVAHDLRSHIDSYQDMAGMVSHLLRTQNYSQIEKIALQIDKTGLILKNLLQNLFQWSLSQKEHLAFTKEHINVKDCVDQVIFIYSPILEAKNIKLNISTDKDQQIHTDKNYFTTILRNLIDNAIKNSNAGTSISLITYIEANIFKLSIQNQAIISEEKLNSIQSLFSSQNEWQVGEHGIGLGLILIKEFSIKMGGYAKVKTIENHIQFELILPSFM